MIGLSVFHKVLSLLAPPDIVAVGSAARGTLLEQPIALPGYPVQFLARFSLHTGARIVKLAIQTINDWENCCSQPKICASLRSIHIAFDVRLSEVSLEPLQHCPQLEEIHIRSHGLRNLAHVALPQLKALTLEKCSEWESCAELARCPLLEELRILDAASLESVSLQHCKKLRKLQICNCKELEDLNGLEKCTSLENLRIFCPSIINIEALRGAVALRFIEVFGGTDALDLAVLRTCRNLATVELHAVKKIGNLSWSSESPLQVFEVTNSPLTDLSSLKECRNLRRVVIKRCPLHSIQGLANARQLDCLILHHLSQLTDLSVLGALPLRELELENTGVSDLSPLEDVPLRELRVARCTIKHGLSAKIQRLLGDELVAEDQTSKAST